MSAWPEDDYVRYLEAERELLARTLIRCGDFSEEARQYALNHYPYEPADKKLRGSVFHNISWHWAMMELHGDRYWLDHPHLARPDALYQKESRELFHTD